MKKILLFFALVVGGFPAVTIAANTFDPATNTLTLDSVTAGGIKYPNVVVRLNQFTVLGVGNSAPVENGNSETCEAENLTEDKFGAIQEGMSIEQVTQIIGCEYAEQFQRGTSSSGTLFETQWKNASNCISSDLI
ncbi:hypothetical protein C8R34_11662 [Nitrosomonas sp. Nm84]|uniref:hypothetical protein n=1 Tax=Nitrosomonas sp. Nm84 TaxID=200124 RepID=UPI000D76D554|nr:hypothetical protein [Nitrosomonas sp. Nm84]PXW86083.1 hypothetical protein C8R34_11662 [Nitrosomonas sp. Nm84]